jgi:hypothetical protein
MSTEANPPGADLQSAADRIGNILNPQPEKKVEAKAVPEVEAPPETPTEPSQETGEIATEEAGNETQEAEPAEQAPEFNSITELAEALEMPLDDFLAKIKGKVKVNGEEREVTLAELRDGYQMESDYRRKTHELSENRKAFEAEREQIATELSRQYQEAQHLTGALEQQLVSEFQAIDWNHLRQTDAAEYAARRQEFNERMAEVQSIKQNVGYQLQRQAEEAAQKQAYELRQILQQESEKLAEAIPEFRDEAKAKEVKGKIKTFLRDYGFSDEEIGSIYDHRYVKILRDAIAYQDLKAKGVETKNKVVNAPKLTKPGSTDKTSAQNRAVQQLRDKLRKSGRVEDAANLIKL